MNTNKTAILIGRWQFPHNGHATLMNTALQAAEQVIVVIGSAYGSRDSLNPFTWEERADMIRSTLKPEDLQRVHFLPIRDYFDNDLWNAAVNAGVKAIAPAQNQIELVGFNKDETSYYLFNFPEWSRNLIDSREVDIDATSLRKMYFLSDDLEIAFVAMKDYVHPKVISYLRSWSFLPAYQLMAKEARVIVEYRKNWTAPYYLTGDAVVTCAGCVLLIQRGSDIGHGLWALPGGFLDPGERFYDGAVRELTEETSYNPYGGSLKAALKGHETFDHPRRSARGRLVTGAYHFDLCGTRTPEVKARSDAKAVKWWLFEELNALESQMFEDHAMILRHFKIMK